ncbi:MAG: outer-membrane lipoprotein carrier protein LolA [Balneolaceae bacterium]
MPVLKNILFLFSLIIAGILQAGYSQNTPEFDRLKSAFENNRIFTASFYHVYSDSFTGEQQEAEGTIWIGKEQYKIEGNNQRMVVDGEISRVYDETRNRLIISEYIEEEDDFAPSRMLQGVDDSYSVSERAIENNQTLITLTSEDPFSVFTEVSIYLSEEGNPLRISATDQVENELTTTFSNGRFTDAGPDTFELNIPEGTELIDLRHDN